MAKNSPSISFVSLSLYILLIPISVFAYTADDFTVNPQSTYAIPPATTKVLILDLTAPEPIDSLRIKNEGTARNLDLTELSVYGDGSSPGWDGDEIEKTLKSSSPFWDTEISGFSLGRIFITVDIASTAVSERTIKPKAIIDDIEITGLERTILAGTSIPTVPVTPIAGTPEAISSTTIRWHFDDRSNNEFGFKILDGSLNILVKKETADLSYIDETGLEPDTEYSGRQVVAFNDRGASLTTSLSVFEAARTLTALEVEEVRPRPEGGVGPQPEPEAEEGLGAGPAEEPTTAEQLRAKIKELQTQLIELLNQLIQALQKQLARIGNFMAGLLGMIF